MVYTPIVQSLVFISYLISFLFVVVVNMLSYIYFCFQSKVLLGKKKRAYSIFHKSVEAVVGGGGGDKGGMVGP